MTLLTFRNIASRRLRFALTTFAVLLGVSFVVASFVLTDGLRSTFNEIIDEGFAGTDVQVQAVSDFDEVMFVDRPIDESLVDVVAAVDGVAVADAYTDSAKIVPVLPDGEPIEAPGGAVVAYNWAGSSISRMNLVEGRVPTGPGEFVIDFDTADNENMVVGETYDIIGIDGPEPFELVGTNQFGEQSSLPGFVLVGFSLEELQRLDGSEGEIRTIEIAAEPGVTTEELIARIEAVVPEGIEAVSRESLVSEAQDDLGGFIDVFGNVLLAFALVAVFVSAFIISNTFNILLGQRVRQLSLLRAIGASSRQVRFSAILEALTIGAVASIAGLGGGILLAFGLRALINTLGFSMPGIQLIISARTIIVALLVGLGVTLIASLSPARRAAEVPPMAGMRMGYKFGSGEGTRRTIIAIVLAVLGAAGMAYSVFGDPGSTMLTLATLGVGSVLMFVATSMFTPLFSTPSASALGIPLEHLPGDKITGHMARQNAARNNKRTASTAAGLMIGLALIAMASVVATSLKESFRDELGSTLTSDFLVTAANQGSFSNRLVDQIDALPEFGDVTAVRYGNAKVADSEHQFAATDLTLLTVLLDVDVVSGDAAASADAEHILIHSDVAEDEAVAVGDPLTVEFAATGPQTFTVGAIYDNEFLIGDYILDLSGWDANFGARDDNVISAKVAPGFTIDQADAALASIEGAFPQLEFETRPEFQDRVEGELNSLLVVINVFLGLAIVIALLGIANTMALSVLERTREIGLMRAIGMTRPQTRRLIRMEAGVVSLFGALLGVLVGLAFGWFAVLAIPDSFISQMVVPWSTLVIYIVIATVAGLFAASFPARRAAKLNILDAISHM
ncbi:MAG: ABC transporter permease [Acidimicrobiales bacterium]|nr:ABC transporter permease [Acidimicrobiales bacterium]